MKPSFDDVTKTTGMTETLAVRAGELRVVRGLDAGRVVRIDSPTFSIGTSATAHLRLRDPGVSREHVRLTTLPDGVLVEDARSKNGTWLGPLRIERATVTSSVELVIGDATIELRLDAGPTALTISAGQQFGAAVGFSPSIRAVFAYLETAARTDVTVLLEGENGVGKEVLASAIHTTSARAAGPFVTVDCGAVPPNLLESELFGHERGAFTGADRARVGLFQQAEGGTLFLDEIGELLPALQPKLLRALEAREIRPVGSNTPIPIHIRVIAATNRNLKDEIASGGFREDLFYRLAVARARVPALRERPDDILPLATRFLREVLNDAKANLPRDIAAMFRAYEWPGNVRELSNVVRRFALLGVRDQGGLFEGVGHGSTRAAESEDLSALPLHLARQRVVDRLEASYFPAVLARFDGNVSKASEHAQIARSSFYRLSERTRGPSSDDGR